MPPNDRQRFCCDEDLALIGYDGRDAAKDLAALRADGPRGTTQELIDVIVANGVDGSVVLDVGAGVGAVHLALLEAGASRAVDVDASREYLAAARDEARRRSLDDRVEHHYGDVVELAADCRRPTSSPSTPSSAATRICQPCSRLRSGPGRGWLG